MRGFLVIAACLGLAACGGSNPTGPSTPIGPNNPGSPSVLTLALNWTGTITGRTLTGDVEPCATGVLSTHLGATGGFGARITQQQGADVQAGLQAGLSGSSLGYRGTVGASSVTLAIVQTSQFDGPMTCSDGTSRDRWIAASNVTSTATTNSWNGTIVTTYDITNPANGVKLATMTLTRTFSLHSY